MSESEVDEAQDPSTDPARLAELSASDDNAVRRHVARNPGTPVELLTQLAKDPDFQVRGAVGGNAPVELLTELADDPDKWLRVGVALNPSTPVELLTELADDPDGLVRAYVAKNASTPVELLTRLAGDSDHRVQDSVAANPVVKALVQEAKESTDEGRLSDLAQMSLSPVRLAVAGNSSTPVEVLTRLADDSEMDVRAAMAENSSTPVEVLTRLAGDSDYRVRQRVAGNPSTPVEVLTRLADYPGADVRMAVAGNPSTPVEVLTRFAERATGGEWQLREAVAGNPSMSAELLQEIERRKFSGLQELIPDPGEWVFYRRLQEIEHDYGGFKAEVTSAVAWDTRDWWFDALDTGLAEKVTGELTSFDVWHNSWAENKAALLPVSDGPPDWFQPPASPGGDEDDSDTDPLLKHNWKLLVSQEATAEDLAALVEQSESVFPGSDLVSAVVARHPNSPAELLSRLAAGNDDKIRWLLTRNPGASDTVKAAAVLTGVEEPSSFKYDDEEDDHDDHDGEASGDQASFSRKIEVSFMEADICVVNDGWASRTLTGADLADFLSDNVLDDEEFKDWADEHRDADGRISTEDFTDGLTEYAGYHVGDGDEWLEWLDERYNLGDMRSEAWDVVKVERMD